MARFEIYESRILVHLNSPKGWAAEATQRAASKVERKSKRICPVDKGLLRASIFKRRYFTILGPGMIVGSNVRYAYWVHEGTGIFGPKRTPIIPVRAQAMVFRVKSGKLIFAAKVKGSKPQPFLRDALDAII